MRAARTVSVTLAPEGVGRGALILVNRAHPIAEEAAPGRLVELAPGVLLERQAALLYGEVMREIGGEGRIAAVSGYRSRAEQEELYADALARHGERYTRTYVALPGCSEHQTGLALDVAKMAQEIDFITPEFPYEGICQRFRQAAVRYGFIQRYPEGREEITGIGHEPWHFRYVGIPHSELMAQLDCTLEEYVGWIRGYPLERRPFRFEAGGRGYEVGYLPARKGPVDITLPGGPYTLSGDNAGGFIAALWEEGA